MIRVFIDQQSHKQKINQWNIMYSYNSLVITHDLGNNLNIVVVLRYDYNYIYAHVI